MSTHISDPELKCPVCEHKSVSIKSLYGHMRNHPDRNWRGMKPPISRIENNVFTSFPSSGLGSDTRPGSGFIFPQWSKTSRRTRTRPGKARMIIPGSNQALPGCSVSKGCDFSGERVTENLPPKKRRLKSGLSSHGKADRVPNPGTESSKKSHVCDVCERAFKSYQALGGHKSHHNINKVHDIMSISGDNESSTNEGRCCVVMHRCPFCDRVFLKGQALGGHKRHCRGRMCSGGEETGSGRFRFDLNELPPEWVPEGTDVACSCV